MPHIRRAITEDMAKSVACALIGSRARLCQLCYVWHVIKQGLLTIPVAKWHS